MEARAGVVQSETRHTLAGPSPGRRVQDLADLDVDTLVAGAISRDVKFMVAAHGIRVMAFLAGDLAEIVAAWAAGQLYPPPVMPCRAAADAAGDEEQAEVAIAVGRGLIRK